MTACRSRTVVLRHNASGILGMSSSRYFPKFSCHTSRSKASLLSAILPCRSRFIKAELRFSVESNEPGAASGPYAQIRAVFARSSKRHCSRSVPWVAPLGAFSAPLMTHVRLNVVLLTKRTRRFSSITRSVLTSLSTAEHCKQLFPK